MESYGKSKVLRHALLASELALAILTPASIEQEIG